jgi:hypothetical protein
MLIEIFTSNCRLKKAICWKEVIVVMRKQFFAKMNNAKVSWRKKLLLEHPQKHTTNYHAFMKIIVDLDIIDLHTISFLAQEVIFFFFVISYCTINYAFFHTIKKQDHVALAIYICFKLMDVLSVHVRHSEIFSYIQINLFY